MAHLVIYYDGRNTLALPVSEDDLKEVWSIAGAIAVLARIPVASWTVIYNAYA